MQPALWRPPVSSLLSHSVNDAGQVNVCDTHATMTTQSHFPATGFMSSSPSTLIHSTSYLPSRVMIVLGAGLKCWNTLVHKFAKAAGQKWSLSRVQQILITGMAYLGQLQATPNVEAPRLGGAETQPDQLKMSTRWLVDISLKQSIQ